MTEEYALLHAKEKFKNHIATYCDYGSVATLTWAKPGHIDHSMRYVFDKKAHTLTVAGDLGYAVICPTCPVDLEHCAKSFQWVDYFTEKIKASSDMYVFDEELARKQLREHLLPEGVTQDEISEREDLIETIMDDYDRYNGVDLNRDVYDALTDIDPDAFEWIGTVGRCYHLRVYLWMYGLQMAYEQVKSKENPELHVTLGISTAHISYATKQFLEHCVNGEEMQAAFRKQDYTGGYGWWITCFETPDDNLPEDLRDCMLFARKFGAGWIMFDADAPVYKELPNYNDKGEKK